MKLLSDVNVLLALVAECHARHPAVRSWWAKLPEEASIHICRPVQMGLLRLLSSEAALGPDAVTLPKAWSLYASLLASGRFAFTFEPPGLDAAWEKLCRPIRRSPQVIMDAYLAAHAQAGGFRLLTLDKGFAQFPSLDYELVAG
jgi:uncharacterized protein